MIRIVVILWGETGVDVFFSFSIFFCFATICGYADDQFFMTCQKKKTRGGSGGSWRTGSNLMLQIAARIGNSALYIIQQRPWHERFCTRVIESDSRAFGGSGRDEQWKGGRKVYAGLLEGNVWFKSGDISY